MKGFLMKELFLCFIKNSSSKSSYYKKHRIYGLFYAFKAIICMRLDKIKPCEEFWDVAIINSEVYYSSDKRGRVYDSGVEYQGIGVGLGLFKNWFYTTYVERVNDG